MNALQEIDASGCRSLLQDWLPVSSAGAVTTLSVANTALQRIPKGTQALQCVNVGHCLHLNGQWLGASAATVRKLCMDGCPVQRIPEGVSALESLSVADCLALPPTFLPDSSASQLRVLNVSGTSLQQLPPNLPALEEERTASCMQLAEDWMPQSSSAIKHMHASMSSVRRLPAMQALVSICVARCEMLAPD